MKLLQIIPLTGLVFLLYTTRVSSKPFLLVPDLFGSGSSKNSPGSETSQGEITDIRNDLISAVTSISPFTMLALLAPITEALGRRDILEAIDIFVVSIESQATSEPLLLFLDSIHRILQIVEPIYRSLFDIVDEKGNKPMKIMGLEILKKTVREFFKINGTLLSFLKPMIDTMFGAFADVLSATSDSNKNARKNVQ